MGCEAVLIAPGRLLSVRAGPGAGGRWHGPG